MLIFNFNRSVHKQYLNFFYIFKILKIFIWFNENKYEKIALIIGYKGKFYKSKKEKHGYVYAQRFTFNAKMTCSYIDGFYHHVVINSIVKKKREKDRISIHSLYIMNSMI